MIREEDLKRYTSYKAAIRILEEELEQAYKPVSSPAIKEVIGGKLSITVPSNPTASALTEIDRLKNKILYYQGLISEVDKFIDGIEDVYIQTICHLHYRKGYSWKMIAKKIYKNTQSDTIRKAAKRYLKEIMEVNNNE